MKIKLSFIFVFFFSLVLISATSISAGAQLTGLNALTSDSRVDLFVSKIEASKTNPQSNEPVKIKAEIRNKGLNDREVEWKFMNNGFPTGQGSSFIKEGKINIKKKDSEKVEIEYTFNKEDDPTHSGLFSTVFIVDPDNKIEEINEDNNLAGIVIKIKEDIADTINSYNPIEETNQEEIEYITENIKEEKENLKEKSFDIKIGESKEIPSDDGSTVITLISIDKTSRHRPSGLFQIQKKARTGDLIRSSECLLNENDFGIFCASVPVEIYSITEGSATLAIGYESPKRIERVKLAGLNNNELSDDKKNSKRTQGCKINGKTLSIGSRLIIESQPNYCSESLKLEIQKEIGEQASFNYECKSNFIKDEKCSIRSASTIKKAWNAIISIFY